MNSQNEHEQLSRRSIGARRNPASQEAILDAAADLLRENGIAGFSIEAVARRARAGKPTIYRWWPNRTVLMLDVYKRFKTARSFPDTGSLRGDLIGFLDNQLIGFWRGSLCGLVYRAVIAEAQNDVGAAEALQAYQTERKGVAVQVVEKAKARGEVPPQTNAILIIDMIVSYAWHQLLLGHLDEAAEGIENVVDTILSGVAGYKPR
jgi:AcrR family transcriptional regulator